MSWLFKDPVVIMNEIMPWLLRIQLTVAWLNLTMPNQTVENSLKAKKIKLSQMNFDLEKQLIKISCTYQSLSFCKIFITKNVRVDLELWGCARFLGPKQPICPEQKLTMKSYNGSRIMAMHHFWTQSGPFTSNNFFFRKPVNHPYVFYSCLSTWQKSKSDINLLVKYWWLKNIEI